MAETRKTKAMLLEEIEKKNDEIKELKKSVEKLDKYKMYDDDAGEIRALFDSFVNSGFSEEQSFELLRICLTNNIQSSSTSKVSYSRYFK